MTVQKIFILRNYDDIIYEVIMRIAKFFFVKFVELLICYMEALMLSMD